MQDDSRLLMRGDEIIACPIYRHQVRQDIGNVSIDRSYAKFSQAGFMARAALSGPVEAVAVY